MCINCNLLCPIHHAFCDIFGFPRNVYMTRSSQWEGASAEYIRCLVADENLLQKFIERAKPIRNMHEYCVKHGLVQRIKDAYEADKHGFSITSNHTINFVTCKYFELQLSEDERDPSFHEIKEVCALLGGSDDKLVCGKWVQVEHIPLDIIKKYKLDAKYKQTAEEYGIQLLEDQVWYADDEVTQTEHDDLKAQPVHSKKEYMMLFVKTMVAFAFVLACMRIGAILF